MWLQHDELIRSDDTQYERLHELEQRLRQADVHGREFALYTNEKKAPLQDELGKHITMQPTILFWVTGGELTGSQQLVRALA